MEVELLDDTSPVKSNKVQFERRDHVQYFRSIWDVPVTDSLLGTTTVMTKTRQLDFREAILREVESRLFVKEREDVRVYPISICKLQSYTGGWDLRAMSDDTKPLARDLSDSDDETTDDVTSCGSVTLSEDVTSTGLPVCLFNPVTIACDTDAKGTASEFKTKGGKKMRKNPFRGAANLARAAFNAIKRGPLSFNWCKCTRGQDVDEDGAWERYCAADVDRFIEEVRQA